MDTPVRNLHSILQEIQPVDQKFIEQAQARTSRLVMPFRALGRLHDISEQLCGIQRTLLPDVSQKGVLIMAGDHGVVAEGVAPYPQAVTGEMVKTFLRGGAGISALSRHIGAQVWVVDMGIIPDLDPKTLEGGDRLWVNKIAPGTANMAQGPAMTREQAETAILTGFDLATKLFDQGIQMIGTGDMGIGNTTPSAAVGVAFTGLTPEQIVGRGTGVDDDGLKRKRDVVQKVLDFHRPDPKNGMDILTKVGGFEIGGIAGVVLAGAFHRRPVVIDGFISTAGAMIAQALCPNVLGYVFAGHCSEETGHVHMLEYLKLQPILTLNMRLGEGTGGVMAMSIIEGASKMFKEMFTFEEASVSEKI